jgi:cleavage and polyadenylation specificity factor subunit 4
MQISATDEQNFERMARFVREQNDSRSGPAVGATKSGVCKMFLHSTCNNPGCSFSHDASKVQICQNYANNLCKYGNACEFSHQMTVNPTRPCNNMRNMGYCENPECKYKHILNICLEYEKGFCSQGSGCTYAHVRKELCKNYMYGFCPEGPNCPNAHPKLLIEWDAVIFHKIDPKIKVITCNKCQIMGHKANNCLSRKTVEVASICPKCKIWHWKDNACLLPEESAMILETSQTTEMRRKTSFE